VRPLLPRRLTLAVAVAALAASAIPAGAAPVSTGVPTVTVSGTTVTVDGKIEGSLTRVIGTDPSGDAVGSGAGVDLSEYTLAFPRKNIVEFGVALGDANPATGYAPQGVVYAIQATIGTQAINLTATPTLDSGLRFGAQTCDASSGVNQCTTTPIEGRYEDGSLIWPVPTTGVGTKISGGTVQVNPSATVGLVGGITFNGGLIDTMLASVSGAAPTATLLIDGATAGAAGLHDAGYSVSATDLSSGSHTVAIRLCDGTNGAEACSTIDLGTVDV
jgi:hypothetical protein